MYENSIQAFKLCQVTTVDDSVRVYYLTMLFLMTAGKK